MSPVSCQPHDDACEGDAGAEEQNDEEQGRPAAVQPGLRDQEVRVLVGDLAHESGHWAKQRATTDLKPGPPPPAHVIADRGIAQPHLGNGTTPSNLSEESVDVCEIWIESDFGANGAHEQDDPSARGRLLEPPFQEGLNSDEALRCGPICWDQRRAKEGIRQE